jgi:hypothetical protein
MIENFSDGRHVEHILSSIKKVQWISVEIRAISGSSFLYARKTWGQPRRCQLVGRFFCTRFLSIRFAQTHKIKVYVNVLVLKISQLTLSVSRIR